MPACVNRPLTGSKWFWPNSTRPDFRGAGLGWLQKRFLHQIFTRNAVTAKRAYDFVSNLFPLYHLCLYRRGRVMRMLEKINDSGLGLATWVGRGSSPTVELEHRRFSKNAAYIFALEPLKPLVSLV